MPSQPPKPPSTSTKSPSDRYPKCVICGGSMTVGQTRAHYVCDPSQFIVYLDKKKADRAKRKMQ